MKDSGQFNAKLLVYSCSISTITTTKNLDELLATELKLQQQTYNNNDDDEKTNEQKNVIKRHFNMTMIMMTKLIIFY